MLFLLGASLVIPAGLPTARAVTPASEPVYEYFFVVDTSGSMVGKGSGNPRVIFPTVQEHVQRFVGSLDTENTTLYVYTFDKGIGETFEIAINSDADKAAGNSFIASLQADGSMTYIYDTLSVVLDRAAAVRAADPGREHVQTVFLFTDGLDNSQGVTLQDIIAKYRLARGENEFLFFRYITLGTTAPAEWKDVEGAEVSEYPDYNLQDIMSIRVRPTGLDFGSLRDRDVSTRTLELSYDARLAGAAIKLDVASQSAEERGALATITPAKITLDAVDGGGESGTMRVDLELSVANKESLDETATYDGRIVFTNASGKLVTFSPGFVDFTFNRASRSVITLEAVDRSDMSIALGELDPFRSELVLTEEVSTRVAFNDRAASSGAYLNARILQDSGPTASHVSLIGADGARLDQVKVTQTDGFLTASVLVDDSAEPGDYTYSVIVEPHAAEIEGAGLESGEAEGERVFTISFSVPEPPLPTSVVVTRWVLGVLAGVIVLAAIAFVALMMISGVSPGRLARVLLHSASPRILDARVELTKPTDLAETPVDLSGRKRAEVGEGTSILSEIPVKLTFIPVVSVSSGVESLEVSISADADASLIVDSAATGTPEYGTTIEVHDGDEIRVEVPGGAVYTVTVNSFDYRR